jgi:hypothetical protein
MPEIDDDIIDDDVETYVPEVGSGGITGNSNGAPYSAIGTGGVDSNSASDPGDSIDIFGDDDSVWALDTDLIDFAGNALVNMATGAAEAAAAITENGMGPPIIRISPTLGGDGVDY